MSEEHKESESKSEVAEDAESEAETAAESEPEPEVESTAESAAESKTQPEDVPTAESKGEAKQDGPGFFGTLFSVLAWPFRAISWFSRRFFVIRKPAPKWQTVSLGLFAVGCCFGLWWWATAGEAEQRLLSPAVLPSPRETFGSFKSLWFDRALTRNTYATLRRVTLGFSLAAVVGVPIGVLSGCFSRVGGFFSPLTIFGRNIPIAALIPLTFSLFGIGEMQKVMFIFIACIAFIISDTAQAVSDVDGRYIDTAYTLGAKRRHVILKVLVPLAMPTVFNSLRVLFGLAFGYIMLAELVKFGGESGGLGDIIITSQRRGVREHILLVLMLIPLVAMAIDRLFYWVQKELFPHQYGGVGILNRFLRVVMHVWEDFKGLIWSRDWTPSAEAPSERKSG